MLWCEDSLAKAGVGLDWTGSDLYAISVHTWEGEWSGNYMCLVVRYQRRICMYTSFFVSLLSDYLHAIFLNS